MEKVKIRYFVLVLVIGILLFVGKVFFYLGGNKEVVIKESTEPAMKLIFKKHVGPYHKNIEAIQEVESWAKARGLDCHLSFGKYLDNPDIVEEARLRSLGGCIVSEFPTELPHDFEKLETTSQKYIRADFSGSPSIGPLKVYPKINAYAQEHRIKLSGEVFEIYEIISDTQMKTVYLFGVM